MIGAAARFDHIAETLLDIRRRPGGAGLADRRRVIALVSDHVPDAKREIRAIATAIDEGVPDALARTERHLIGVEMDRQAAGLEAATGIRADLARTIVRCFAFALELGPLPSVYEEAPVAPAMVPTGHGTAWAGVSAPVAAPPRPTPAAAPPAIGFARLLPRLGIGLAGAVAIAVGLSQMTGGTTGGGAGNDPQENGAATAEQGFAGELADLGVRAKSELEPNVGSPTPVSIPVGERITTMGVQRLITAEPQALLIDVLDGPHPQTLQRALYMPTGGMPGTFEDNYQSQFEAALAQATGGDKARTLVFFCAGASCWESYNAALRANAAGYSRIHWYRGGLASWAEAGLPMEPLPAFAAPGANFYKP